MEYGSSLDVIGIQSCIKLGAQPIFEKMNNSTNSRPRVLVTGARGKLATHAIPRLREHFDLRLTDVLPARPEDQDYIQADLTDFSHLEDLMIGMDAVVHLAIASEPAVREPLVSGRMDPFEEQILQVNILGTSYLFEAARRAGVRRVVFVSSMTVLWGDRHKSHYDHLTPPEPKNLYACSKIFGENIGQLYARSHGVSVICLRLGQPYPINHAADEAWKVNRRSRSIYVAIEDITSSLLCALHTDKHFGVYNIVSASDNQRIDLSHAREIGYVPRSYFAEGRREWYEDGSFPEATEPVVCH